MSDNNSVDARDSLYAVLRLLIEGRSDLAADRVINLDGRTRVTLELEELGVSLDVVLSLLESGELEAASLLLGYIQRSLGHTDLPASARLELAACRLAVETARGDSIAAGRCLGSLR